MKKLLWGIVLVVMMMSLFGGVLPASADEANFEKAGQKILEQKESVLIEKKTAIEVFVAGAVTDRVITGDEMITLNEAVDDFDREKKDADEYLEFYDLATSTVLDQNIVDMVKSYYNQDGLYKRDDSGETRAYFVRLTGDDVVVEKSGITIDGGVILTMILAAIFLFLAVIFGLFIKKDGASAVAAMVICIFLFIGMMSALFFG